MFLNIFGIIKVNGANNAQLDYLLESPLPSPHCRFMWMSL